MTDDSLSGHRTVPPRGQTPDDLTGIIMQGIRLDAKIGEGGMGAVYRGTQLDLDRLVAVKVLSPLLSKDAGLVERFRLEAKALAKCRDPRIVQIHTTFAISGQFAYVMDYADAGSLRDWIDKNGPLPENEAAHLAREAALGLAAAADKGIVHRDIKPDNLLLSSDGSLRIADFGLMKAADMSMHLTRSGVFMGTPAYMSPERRGSAP